MSCKSLFLLVFLPFCLFSQQSQNAELTTNSPRNISDCYGAIQMDNNTISTVKLTGSGGEYNDYINLPGGNPQENNSLWFSCRAEISGYLSIILEEVNFDFNYSVFKLKDTASCHSILSGSILPINKGVNSEKNRLIYFIDSLTLEADDQVLFCIDAVNSDKSEFDIISTFSSELSPVEISELKNVRDFRTGSKIEKFSVEIRDMKTKYPVSAKVIISGTRNYNALYVASDFIFPANNQLKMQLKIDASGYFPEDREINLRDIDSAAMVVYLKPVQTDESIALEGLRFESQSAVLIPKSYIRLRRLKDFMALNAEVKIEIRGHVHLEGRNTFRAKLLSKKRAKKVKRYLVDSGIQKSRMSISGFGNKEMKYPEAETESQIQANRRVEILIK